MEGDIRKAVASLSEPIEPTGELYCVFLPARKGVNHNGSASFSEISDESQYERSSKLVQSVDVHACPNWV